MKKFDVYIRLLSCSNSPGRFVNSRRMSMEKRQNSTYPSSIYPRLESVDLQEDANPSINPADSCCRDINFENHVDAFRNKSTWEIVRALTVLKLCSVNTLVDNSLAMMRWVDRVFGRRALRLMFKPTFYNQFVGGETTDEIRTCIRKLAGTNVRALLAVTMEEDLGEGGDEKVYDNNCQRVMEALEITTAEDTPSPLLQLKLSGLLQAELLVTLGEKYTNSSNKMPLIRAISEGLTDEGIDATLFKDILDDKKLESLNKSLQRLKKICLDAKSRGVKILVDAEYTYMNPGLSLLTLAAVSIFNKEIPLIWNTYQCYLKDTKRSLEREMNLILSEMKVCFGAKVVRGAYMLQEKAWAEKHKLPDSICDDYNSTGKNYNDIICQLLEKAAELGSRFQFMVASHNEDSVKLAMKRIFELGIEKHRGEVCFAQLYGMCDQVTNPLAHAGFAVYKSIPYGTVDKVLPYLARRAVENKSVIAGARKEKALLSKEFWRRTARTLTCRSWSTQLETSGTSQRK